MFAIGEASRRSGVSVETIRYYEREGITAKPGRAANGRRLYSDAEISELAFIKRCRDLGFSLPDVRPCDLCLATQKVLALRCRPWGNVTFRMLEANRRPEKDRSRFGGLSGFMRKWRGEMRDA